MMLLYIDNSPQADRKFRVTHARTRHIDIRRRYIRESVENFAPTRRGISHYCHQMTEHHHIVVARWYQTRRLSFNGASSTRGAACGEQS